MYVALRKTLRSRLLHFSESLEKEREEDLWDAKIRACVA